MKPASETLIIIGASARAAAFSALRAGLHPWCADLFADADLRAWCPTLSVARSAYPEGLRDMVRQAPPGPWMYTGALENRRSLLCQIARQRLLWGNEASVLAVARAPWTVVRLLQEAGLCCPRVWRRPADVPRRTRCLVKPLASAGGRQIQFWSGDQSLPSLRAIYFQEYVEGESWAAAFIGDGRQARLLGVTRQLVGERWLHAAPFHYCGSIGPLSPALESRQALETLGQALVNASGMRGLFGIDCIVRDGVPWLVEVNPRYTASMEVVEFALGLPVLALHRQVFDPHAPAPPKFSPAPSAWIGKAIWFTPEELVFPEKGPWQSALRYPGLESLPAFADIPAPGQRVAAGWPVLTFFSQAASQEGCLDALRQVAAELDRWLLAR